MLHQWQDKRTAEECAWANVQANINPTSFFVDRGGPLKAGEVKKVSSLFTKVSAEASAAASVAKERWKRPRPFLTDTTLVPCVTMAPNFRAYPSGHATIGHATAEALARLFPDRRAAFLARGNEIALNRVISGVHHPSDIEAGKECARQVMQKLLADPGFVASMEELARQSR